MKAITKLTREEIIHLAKLANLTLNEDEIKKYQDQLSKTLEYISNLNELNTDNIPPTNQVTSLTDVYFPDGEKNKRLFLPDEAVKNAKNKKANYFVVKRIL